MEKHVTSLELSKRLKALGVKQESEFYWVESQINHKWVIERKEMVRLEIFGDSATSAFLASELGEMMKSKGMGVVAYSSIQGKWWCSGGKWDVGKQAYDGLEQSDTMQDTLALMLEYLIQNKLITI